MRLLLPRGVIMSGICMAVVLPIAVPVAAGGDAAASNELKRLETVYDNGIKKLDADRLTSAVALQNQYIMYLTTLEKKVQDSGKLDMLLEMQKEKERFLAARMIGEKDLSTDVPELRTLQDNYLKALAQLPMDKARSVSVLIQQYDKSLAALQKKLTKTGKIDAAVEVRNLRDSLKDRPEVAEANLVLADSGAKKSEESAQKTKAQAGKTTDSKAVEKADDAAVKKKYSGKPGKYIKSRFGKLCKVVLKQDWTAASEYVDPTFVKKHGIDAVESYFRSVFPILLRIKDNPRVRMDAGDVDVDDSEEKATLVPKIWFNNDWHDQPPMYWMQYEGDWFVDLTAAGKKAPPQRWPRNRPVVNQPEGEGGNVEQGPVRRAEE